MCEKMREACVLMGRVAVSFHVHCFECPLPSPPLMPLRTRGGKVHFPAAARAQVAHTHDILLPLAPLRAAIGLFCAITALQLLHFPL